MTKKDIEPSSYMEGKIWVLRTLAKLKKQKENCLAYPFFQSFEINRERKTTKIRSICGI